MASLTLSVSDFRILERLDWEIDGVCLLTGANGSGKSTVLDSLLFLRALFAFGLESALRTVDATRFRRWDAPLEESVEFSVKVEELRWKLSLPFAAQGIRGQYGEELWRGDEHLIHAPAFHDYWFLEGEKQPVRDESRCCLKVLWDRERPEWMEPLTGALHDVRVYKSYWLNQVKSKEAVEPTDSFLHHTGRNLWSVLANWKASPIKYNHQFEWVLSEAQRAFPGLLGPIEFDRGLPNLYPPSATDPSESFFPDRAAEGLLTGLLHLTAVAGAKDHSLLAFDEVENQLHPHAIRSIVRAMRQQADERDLSIILTTHSPVVLNQFREQPEQVFVMGHGEEELSVPASMDELHDEAWLAQAKLGTLYERLAFAAPSFREDPA